MPFALRRAPLLRMTALDRAGSLVAYIVPHICHPERSLPSCTAGRKQAKDLCIPSQFSMALTPREQIPVNENDWKLDTSAPSSGKCIVPSSDALRPAKGSVLRMTALDRAGSLVSYIVPHICHPERSLPSCTAGRKQAKDLCIPSQFSMALTPREQIPVNGNDWKLDTSAPSSGKCIVPSS